jgi:hypothetical protein
MAVNEPKKRMRGQHQSSSSPFGYVGLESRGPAKHPLRPGVTPHVAQNTYDTGRARQTSAIDGRTTRHPGYTASQRVRKRIEEVFGWVKASAGLRKTKFRSQDRVRSQFILVYCWLQSRPNTQAARGGPAMICTFHAVITPDGDLWRACWRAMEPLLVAKREKRL